MEIQEMILEIKDPDDGVLYTFITTAKELLQITTMPFKKSGTNDPSQTTLKKAKLTAYRNGSNISFTYENRSGTGTIGTNLTYEEVCSKISVAITNKSDTVQLVS